MSSGRCVRVAGSWCDRSAWWCLATLTLYALADEEAVRPKPHPESVQGYHAGA